MTAAEFYTYQFYAWEFRGRGWFVANEPVHLEPPFIPFFRHGGSHKQIDDGKRPTLFSKLSDAVKGVKSVFHQEEALDYETIEPYLFEPENDKVALRILFPKDRRNSGERMKALLNMLSFIFIPLSFEIIGTGPEIIFQFVTDESYAEDLETYCKAYFPHYTTQRNDTFRDTVFNNDLPATMLVDYGLKEEFIRPITTLKNSNFDPLTALIAVLDKLDNYEHAGIQILFQPAVNQWNDSIQRSVTMYDKSSFFTDCPEFPQLAIEKIKSMMYGVTFRAFAQAENAEGAEDILRKISTCIMHGSKSAYNQLAPLLTTHYDFVTRAEDIILRESHRLGMLLNQDELLTFLHFPDDTISSKKLDGIQQKTKAVPHIALDKKYVIGSNTHNGIEQDVTFDIEDRLKHTHIIGATGTGKSTLIAQLIQQDIEHKHSVVLFDPHGDLVEDILAYIPEDRLKDVVLVDPADVEFPIGLNILEAHDDVEKEVLSSDLVSAFKRFATSWGDQMSGVLGNAILAILENSEGGSLHDLKRFLIEPDYRVKVLKKVTDPSVLYYWQKEFPFLKTNSIGPILIRLDAFLRPKSVRNMVIQKNGLDFETLLNSNKIILLKLSQGLIGKENSFMLGSLILSKVHQAIQRRQRQAIRNPVFIYLDEFQNFITPSIKEMLSGIRKYNAGLILVHQDLQQLQREDGELLNSVLSNTNTRIVFRVGEQDAKRLQDGFSNFDYTDLQNLSRGQAVMRIEQPQYDCSLDTKLLQPVPEHQKESNRAEVIANSRRKHAVSRQMVEQMLYDSFEDIDKPKESKPTSEKPIASNPPHATEESLLEIPKSKKEPHTKKSPSNDVEESAKETISTHRYLQNLVKKVAESKGYVAVLEKQLPHSAEKVDVFLEKDKKAIAVEICVTTDVEWEVHNITKCLTSEYEVVVSLSGDIKQLERIKQKCFEVMEESETKKILFFTPDAFFSYLDESVIPQKESGQVMKGYRINISYDPQSESETERKRSLINQVIANSMKRNKKK